MSVARITLCVVVVSTITGCGALRNLTENEYRPTRELPIIESKDHPRCQQPHPDPPFKFVHDAIDNHINKESFRDSFWYNPYKPRTGREDDAAQSDSTGFRPPRSKGDGSRQANKAGGPVITE